MPSNEAREIVGSFEGSPPPEAFHVERVVDPFTLAETIGMVRHASHPFVIPGTGWAQEGDEVWPRIGEAYLRALTQSLQGVLAGDLPALMDETVWLTLLEPRSASDANFGWLPILPPQSADARAPGAVGSYWARRAVDGQTASEPALLVLLAGAVDTEHQLQAGSDMGLRLVLHVDDAGVRIHGVTLSGLSTDRVLKAAPRPTSASAGIFDLVRNARDAIGAALDCRGKVWITNIENACQPDAPDHLFATGYALRFPKSGEGPPGEGPLPRRSANARARTYDFRVELAREPGGTVGFVRIHRDIFIGAGATLACFVQDAASNDREDLQQRSQEPRATLPDDALEPYRDRVDAALAYGDALTYTDDAKVDCFETWAASERSARSLGGRTVPARKGLVVATDGDVAAPPVRSDQQASHDAHLRSAEFFGRMSAYGLDPVQYFRFARLPLVHRVRPKMRWAPDGELPSAEVRPFLTDPQAWARDRRERRPSDTLQLLLNFGSADPWHRHKLPLVQEANGKPARAAGRKKAQYLSVASDPRWAWHEFGHVLNFASTGELEFPFAHSAGDALAAIACDPTSRLARADDPDGEQRHVTYPWIPVPGRSHGRSALRGYGWCGCRNLTRLNFTAPLARYHHSYFGEQMLSSSLFRLYRSLGGDTRDKNATPGDTDEAMRLSASDYCIYLIMRAIALLGPATLAPARSPDQFVSALIDADLGTGHWTLGEVTWPFNRDPRRPVVRQGGRVHKVIRWAFEQQGLYATDDPRQVRDTLGLPPSVDLYIADRRGPEGAAGDGGYAPVPLRPGTDQPWHAHGNWVRREQGRLVVRLGNRGQAAASVPATVRAWAWITQNASWRALPAPSVPVLVSRQSPGEVRLGLPDDLPEGPLWVLVSADTPADPSNLGAQALPPHQSDALVELVAHDNNLALACM